MRHLRMAKRTTKKRDSFIKTQRVTGLKIINYPTEECQEWMRKRQEETLVMEFHVGCQRYTGGKYHVDF